MKLLVVIASYGLGNDRYLRRLIDEYSSMSYSVDIVVCSNVAKALPEHVELVVGMPNKDPWSLPFAHKQILADRRDKYDLFIYSEDDTLATEKNIAAFLRLTEMLPANEIAGFLRFEQCPDGSLRYCDINGHYHWDHTSVVCRDRYTLAFHTNEHAAFYILTRRQLDQAIQSGGFLVPPHRGKYDLACTAATDPYTQCGFKKLICISHIKEFLLWHLPNKYVATRFGTPENQVQQQLDRLMDLDENQRQWPLLIPVQTKLQDAWHSKDYYEPVCPDLVNVIPLSARNILSIGCGAGATESFLADRGAKVTAVCLDPVIAACAQREDVETLSGPIEGVFSRLSDRSFDCLLYSNILHLASEPYRLFNGFSRFLKQTGDCIVLSPNLYTLKTLVGKMRRDERYTSIGDYDESGTHGITSSKLKSWLAKTGMSIQYVKRFVPEKKRGLSRAAFGLADAMLAENFLVFARKDPAR